MSVVGANPHFGPAPEERECAESDDKDDFLTLPSRRWVAINAAPPATRLMPLQPAPNDTTVLQAPKYLPDAVVQVPQRDADGNPVSGVRLPDMEVPLGVHGAQNVMV